MRAVAHPVVVVCTNSTHPSYRRVEFLNDHSTSCKDGPRSGVPGPGGYGLGRGRAVDEGPAAGGRGAGSGGVAVGCRGPRGQGGCASVLGTESRSTPPGVHSPWARRTSPAVRPVGAVAASQAPPMPSQLPPAASMPRAAAATPAPGPGPAGWRKRRRGPRPPGAGAGEADGERGSPARPSRGRSWGRARWSGSGAVRCRRPRAAAGRRCPSVISSDSVTSRRVPGRRPPPWCGRPAPGRARASGQCRPATPRPSSAP